MKKILFLLLAGFSFNSFAHDYSGVLPAETSAVDFLVISCDIDNGLIPDKMYFKINSSNTAPLISAQIAKGNFATNMTPNRGGMEIYQGAGEYRVTVDKNGAGIASYSIEYHCESGGDHTQTTIVRY